MTWGQLRFQLQVSAPGVKDDLLDEFLNSRYEQVLEACDWEGLKGSANIAVSAAYESTTDTVTLTVGSSGVVGVGTAWDASLVGQKFYRPGDMATYQIGAVLSPTVLSLDRAYEGMATDATGTVYAASQYTIYQDIYALPADCGTITEIRDPLTGFLLHRFTQSELDASAGTRNLIGDPRAFCPVEDSPESSPPIYHQVQFYPPPKYARGYPLRYQRAALGFDGQTTSAAPLPWISATVLLNGCRADIQGYLATQTDQPAAHLAAARAYESKFAEELARLLRVEHAQRRKKRPLQMADRFTRHRLARAGRNYSSSWRHGQGGPQ